MSVSLQLRDSQYAEVLQALEQMENEYDEFRERVIDTLESLKTGEIELDQVEVSDGDFEVVAFAGEDNDEEET